MKLKSLVGFAKVRNGFMRPDSFFGSLSLKHGATIVPIVDLVSLLSHNQNMFKLHGVETKKRKVESVIII